MFFRTDAIVLRKTKLSDSNLILTLFTKKSGKMEAVAQGGRNPRSRLNAGSQPFVFGQYDINTGDNYNYINNIELKDSFYHIRDDLGKLAYGSWFLELTEASIVTGETNHRLFEALLETVNVLATTEVPPDVLKVAFELKCLDSQGLRPELRHCVSCQATGDQKWRFSMAEGGLICESCAPKYPDLYVIGKTLPKIMMYMLLKDMRVIGKTQFHDSYIRKLDTILYKYILHHYDRKGFKSHGFLEALRDL